MRNCPFAKKFIESFWNFSFCVLKFIEEKCDMIKLDEALKAPIKPEDLKDIIESDNIEKKFVLAIQ